MENKGFNIKIRYKWPKMVSFSQVTVYAECFCFRFLKNLTIVLI